MSDPADFAPATTLGNDYYDATKEVEGLKAELQAEQKKTAELAGQLNVAKQESAAAKAGMACALGNAVVKPSCFLAVLSEHPRTEAAKAAAVEVGKMLEKGANMPSTKPLTAEDFARGLMKDLCSFARPSERNRCRNKYR